MNRTSLTRFLRALFVMTPVAIGFASSARDARADDTTTKDKVSAASADKTEVAPRCDGNCMGLDLGIASGFEGGNDGDGNSVFRRARTRIRGSFDWRSDEDSRNGVGAVAFVEIEPHTSFGGELRYMHWFGSRFTAFAGATGDVAPHVLFGGVVGLTYHMKVSNELSLFFEPSFSALPFGTDLATDGVLMWGLLTFGARGDIASFAGGQ